ncbi:MAG TPA: DUF4245 domain-containing protein [Cryptosporangiaceae bacterium]|nr:DUF4245 domain-containing protein [Cryptosporangiaceae bacterium]
MTSREPVPAARPPAPGRRRGTVRDLAISLAVLVLPLLAVVALCQPRDPGSTPVDPTGAYVGARAQAGFAVREPVGLDGWAATDATFRRTPDGAATLRVGYLTPAGRYAQLVQSSVPADRLIPAELGAGRPRGVATIRGVSWQRYSARQPEDRAYVLLEPAVSVILVGDATDDEMRTFLSSLRIR